jgi:RNA polymerase sigma-70 factor, ECF subfamily
MLLSRPVNTVGAEDQELVRQMALGESAALGELFARYGGMLLGLALRIVKHQAEAEDLVHDVLLEAWKSADSFDPRRGNVRTWLTVRMRSRAIDVIKSARLARNAGAEPLGYTLTESTPIVDVYANSRLAQGMLALSAEQRSALELAYFEGLTCAEIADRQGIPVGTVKSRTAHALAKLRAGFESGQS